jgi:integrating conjugative element protein (TIGR03752 family)
MALVLLFVGIKLFSGSAAPARPAGSANPLTPEEMKALGIEGDTPRDTVATLVAQVKQLRNELQTALNDNKNQKSENERLRARESAIDQRIQSALDGERGRLQQDREQVASDRQQTQGLLQDLQRRLDGFPARAARPICRSGWAWRTATARASAAAAASPAPAARAGWSRRCEAGEERQQRRPNFPTSFGPAQKTLSDTADNVASTVADAAAAPWARPSRSTRCRRTRR